MTKYVWKPKYHDFMGQSQHIYVALHCRREKDSYTEAVYEVSYLLGKGTRDREQFMYSVRHLDNPSSQYEDGAPCQRFYSVERAERAAAMAAAGMGVHLDHEAHMINIGTEIVFGEIILDGDQFVEAFTYVPAWHPARQRKKVDSP